MNLSKLKKNNREQQACTWFWFCRFFCGWLATYFFFIIKRYSNPSQENINKYLQLSIATSALNQGHNEPEFLRLHLVLLYFPCPMQIAQALSPFWVGPILRYPLAKLVCRARRERTRKLDGLHYLCFLTKSHLSSLLFHSITLLPLPLPLPLASPLTHQLYIHAGIVWWFSSKVGDQACSKPLGATWGSAEQEHRLLEPRGESQETLSET